MKAVERSARRSKSRQSAVAAIDTTLTGASVFFRLLAIRGASGVRGDCAVRIGTPRSQGWPEAGAGLLRPC